MGYLHADVSTGGGSTDGYLVGVGYDHMLTDNMFIGGELTHNRYNDLPGGAGGTPSPTTWTCASV